MGKGNRYTFGQQYSALRTRYVHSYGKLLRNGFEWYCSLMPSQISDCYEVRIRYKEPNCPKVFVVFPKHLKLAEGAKTLPHVYDTKTQQLCLFMPDWNEWNSSMLIADTIVHWTLLWLRYYEYWRITGKWLGGGHGDWDAKKTEEKIIV